MDVENIKMNISWRKEILKNTLLLHIGTPKTGTTALQKFLSENSEELKKQGWDFPDMLKEWQIQYGERAYKSTQRNGLLLRWSIIKKWSEEKKEKLWQMILKHLQSSNVILSDEVIWDYDPSTTTAEIIRSVKNRYDNIKIVCYLRRQDLYIESYWNQCIKKKMETRDIDQMLLEDTTIRYKEKLDEIAEIVGREKIIVRVYEREQFEGSREDITSDFCKVLGIKDTWDGIVLPGIVNERIDAELIEMKRLFNQEYKKRLDEPCYVVTRNAMEYAANHKFSKVGYISNECRKELIKKYSDDNYYIATNYMGRKDGVLFKEKVVDMPEYKIEFTDREKEIIKIFANVVADLRSYIKELKNEGLPAAIVGHFTQKKEKNIYIK